MKRNKAWLFWAFAGAVLMAVGVKLGEVQVVLNKATHMCLECIGIG